jgi:hypothetical protein
MNSRLDWRNFLLDRRFVTLLWISIAAMAGTGVIAWAALLAPGRLYPGAVKSPRCVYAPIERKAGYAYAAGLIRRLFLVQYTCYTTGDRASQVIQWYTGSGWKRLPFSGALIRDSAFSFGSLEVHVFKYVTVNTPPGSTYIRLEHHLSFQWRYQSSPAAVPGEAPD